MNESEKCCPLEKELKITELLIITIENLKTIEDLYCGLSAKINGIKPIDDKKCNSEKYNTMGMVDVAKETRFKSEELTKLLSEEIYKL